MDVSSFFFNDDTDIFGSKNEDYDQPLENFYFVPYWWWAEACEALFSDTSEMKGVFYAAESRIGPASTGDCDFSSEVVLNTSPLDVSGKRNGAEEGDRAFLAEWMFLRAAKWHNDVKVGEFLATEDNVPDIFPLQIKLSVSWCSWSLVVKICRQDNEAAAFRKACDIFYVESGVWGFWDFSGQTTQLLARGQSKDDHFGTDEEIPLELQVFGSPNVYRRGIRGRDEMEAEESLTGDSFSSLGMHGSTDHVTSTFKVGETPAFSSCYLKVGNLGLTGLCNLGNTCFMNSAIQCLVHTPNLVDYFLGDYKKDINTENPLGMNGELALKFGDLLRKLWAPRARATPIAPGAFKSKLSAFAPQFGGYNQHDSQEFLAFLLDGLHEDLNRVKVKPYIEAKDIEGRPVEEVAEEYWVNHLARNDSVIVDLFQGQYQSTLVCPVCKKLSMMFDPFMYLSLPLPSAKMRIITLTIFSTDGTTMPYPVTIAVPKYGQCKDLVQALSTACSLRDDETLLIAEIFNHRVLQFLDNPSGTIELLRDDDRLVAYRLPKGERSCLIVFMHESLDRGSAGTMSYQERFGIPLVACISDLSVGSEILKGFRRLLSPFLMPNEYSLNDDDDDYDQIDADNKDTRLPEGDLDLDAGSGDDSNLSSGFQFFLVEGGLKSKGLRIKMNEPLPIPQLTKMFNVIVCWSEEMKNLYDTCLLSNLPPICQPEVLMKQPQEHISLYKCLEAFLKEELLGEEDMWFCPNCKEHQQASKKLDVWRLPEILIIHLKRFSYSRFFNNKLETFIDFPVDDFDLSSYMSHKNDQVSQCYKLFAVSNHYGSLTGGHYTAFAQLGDSGWYEFDDSHVSLVREDQIKTSAAYVLFYRRKS